MRCLVPFRWGQVRALVVGSLLLLTAGRPAAAQDLRDFPYADSLTATLAGQGRWAALDSTGRQALHLGTDYPALRQRLGYAALQTNQPALAIRHYGRAVVANPADEESRLRLVVAYLRLGQPDAARLAARPLTDSLRQALHLAPWRAASAVELESGGKFTPSPVRGPAGFGRLSVSSLLGTRLKLTQSSAYYGQQVQLPTLLSLPTYRIRQGEYHALLTVQLHLAWQLKLGYNYLFTDFGTNYYHSHLGYVALRYTRPYWSAQAGVYAGRITGTTRAQTDGQLTVYPLGNLHLYAFGRGSLVGSGTQTYPNALLGLGGRLRPRLWGETYWSPGNVPVLAEQEGTYVYNLLDPLRYRLGCSTYALLSAQWRVHLHYTLARYAEIRSPNFYLQHSLAGGFAWTW